MPKWFYQNTGNMLKTIQQELKKNVLHTTNTFVITVFLKNKHENK